MFSTQCLNRNYKYLIFINNISIIMMCCKNLKSKNLSNRLRNIDVNNFSKSSKIIKKI